MISGSTDRRSGEGEARKDPRYPADLEARVRKSRAPAPGVYSVRNISLGGVFLPLNDYALEVGERFYLDLVGPKGPVVRTLARVAWENRCPTEKRWARSQGIGLHFLYPDGGASAALRALVENVIRASARP